ncbi:hypothetical protein AJ79_05882 [Helicocarpus griseus UAMH5409]|uniref:Tryptophan synthase beta chain-like PALP domain-containing protein n=1 Tax=Helicocarpus griseus UAMH5409 TaxID=1447875 RepID=A0A2B7XJ41_9EURO|nr:hypothetical protein AJ79_05882 [Helicocarpus griseus UAMH5409]
MAPHPSLTPQNILAAHALIKPYIRETPVLTSKSLNALASTPQSPEALIGTPFEGQKPADPKLNFFFKCENFQRIGAFKARGAFHALLRLVEREGAEVVRGRGVVTHSSGNHAQALSLAAATLSIPATIVMPSTSSPLKIAGTHAHNPRLLFSGPTSQEREAVVADVIKETNAFLIPPYDAVDIVLGQGTVGVEVERQVGELVVGREPGLSVHVHGKKEREGGKGQLLDAIITPLGGGGLTAGVATWFSDKPGTRVFGAEPAFEGADDCRRSLETGERVRFVKSTTIADGLRTPVGEVPWGVISDKSRVEGVYAVSERQIREAMRLVWERVKVVVEPSAVVPLAVALFDEGWRGMVERVCAAEGIEGWDVGIVFSGGNVAVEGIGGLFTKD